MALISQRELSAGLSRQLGAEGTGFVQAGEMEALVGVNSSFPFTEWKFMRRLSRRRGRVLTVVHGVRTSQ